MGRRSLPRPLEGHSKLSPFKARMAMAVRSKNAHWKMRDIRRAHWLAVGDRHGIVTEDGRAARFVVDELVERTPAAIRAVREKLPKGFPESVSESILEGLHQAANRLAA